MRPTLFPPFGTAIQGGAALAGILSRVAEQASENAMIAPSGNLDAMTGAGGTQVGNGFGTTLQCFEIVSDWKTTNTPNAPGPTRETFWTCTAYPVVYWWQHLSGNSFWAADSGDAAGDSGDGLTAVNIFLAPGEKSASALDSGFSYDGDYDPEDAFDAGDGFATLPQIGMWVWCTWDYQADVWRVLAAPPLPDDTIWGILDDALPPGGSATLSIWKLAIGATDWVGASADTYTNQVVYAPAVLRTTAISAGTWCGAKKDYAGNWRVLWAECT
jgi:hypothetical protein